MTQISILRDLLNQAHDFYFSISAALETVQNNDGPIQPLEWHELAAASQSANLTANLLDHMIRRADEPIPYSLTMTTNSLFSMRPCAEQAHAACFIDGADRHWQSAR